MKTKALKITSFIFIVVIFIIATISTANAQIPDNERRAFITNESREDFGKEIEIIKKGWIFTKYKIDSEEKITLNKDISYYLELFIEENASYRLNKDSYLYRNLNENSKTDMLLYMNSEINIVSVGTIYSELIYDDSIYYVLTKNLSKNNLETENIETFYLINNSNLYEYPSKESKELTAIEKWTKIESISKIKNFYKIEYEGNICFINEENLMKETDLFSDIIKDVYATEDINIYNNTLKEKVISKIEKGTKIRIIKENPAFLQINYGDNIYFIENKNIKDSSKIFVQSNDKIVTTSNLKLYSGMNSEGQYTIEVSEGTVLNRLYFGKQGYDIVQVNNTIGYIESNKTAPISNVSKEVRTSGYIKETIGVYSGMNNNEANLITKFPAGTKVLVLEETFNGYSKVTDGNLIGYVASKIIVSAAEAFYTTGTYKYANRDIIFNYLEDGKEGSIIIPKGMFVYQKESSYAGIDRIIYDNKEGIINSNYLSDTCEVSYNETFMTYKSDTLEVRITKHNKNGTEYWISEIITDDASRQLKCGLSNGTYGGTRENTSSQVSRNGGIIGVNGSGFWYSDGTIYGNIVIKNKQVIKDGYGEHHLMCIDKNGKIFSAPDPSSAADLLSMGVVNTFGFGPMLIIDGKDVRDIENGYDPRTAIGMKKPGHYIIITADGRRKTSKGFTLAKLTQIFQEYDVEYAYNLDGGGSTTLAFLGKVINIPSDGNERPCADTIYFIE